MTVNTDPTGALPQADAQGRIMLKARPVSLPQLAGNMAIPAFLGGCCWYKLVATGGAYDVGLVLCGICAFLLAALAGSAWLSHARPGYVVIEPEGLGRGGGWTAPLHMPWQAVREIKLSSVYQPPKRYSSARVRTLIWVTGPRKMLLPLYNVAPLALSACLRDYQARASPKAEAAFIDETIPPQPAAQKPDGRFPG